MHADWVAFKGKFRTTYGEGLPDNKLLAQSYLESVEERLAYSCLEADLLSLVVSLADENIRKARKPWPTRHLGLHLDSSLTIQAKRRITFSLPSNIEELRSKYKVLENFWVMAQMRKLERPQDADLSGNGQRPVGTANRRITSYRPMVGTLSLL